MGILIRRELSSFSVPIRLFISTRPEHDRFEFTAISISGETACVHRKAHTEVRSPIGKSPESDYDPTTIFEAMGCGVNRQSGLSVSHALAFLGFYSKDRVLMLYFLFTVEGSPVFSGMSPRDDISEEANEVVGAMLIDKRIIQSCLTGGVWEGEKTLGLLLALEKAFEVHEGNESQGPSEKFYIPAQMEQPQNLHMVRPRYLRYDLFNLPGEGLLDWEVVDRCFVDESDVCPASVLSAADYVSPEYQLAALLEKQRDQTDLLLTDIGDINPTMEWTCVHVRQMNNAYRNALRVVLFGRPWPTEKQKYQRSAMGELVDIPADTGIL